MVTMPRVVELAGVAFLVLAACGALADDRPTSTEEAKPAERGSESAVAGAVRETGTGRVEAEYEYIRDMCAPALVTIKFVQKTQGRFGEFEGENEINGVMIAPGGLVLCSNMMLGGSSRRGSGRSTPTEIKVLVGDDTQGLDAKFVARDTELDLAWLQVKEPGDRKFPALDLDAAVKEAVTPRLGQRVLTLGVMGRYFGQEVLVSEGFVAGRTRKPRELYVIRGAIDTDPGLPVFTTEGHLLGFACIQTPDADEVSGNAANLTARGRGLILPVQTVAKATARAKEVRSEEAREEKTPPPTNTEDNASDDAGLEKRSPSDQEQK